jgi:signal transduction histidine kinase
MGRVALAAQPLAHKRGVLVLSDSLSDVEANVALIRRQILYSGAVALVIALLAGYLVARALSQRVNRLEQAARKVAAGDFSNPIRADSDDELGQLATAFDDMQNQLARLDRARKQFIASASHELRTPIFSLGGFLELLADEDLDEDTRRAFLEQLRGQVDRMRMLATELLDLSRLESGALELHPEPTDLGELAREVAAEFTPAAQRHRTDVRLDVREPLELECDPERVAQVLRILLDNAIVHTPAGTGVQVSAARSDGHVRLEVSDHGLGIKRQNMPHIFEPFFSSDEEAQGAGLGLAIARELAERMQGELSVRSIPGATTFSLVLPG